MTAQILVADDSDQMREFYRTMLADFTIDIAQGGHDLVRQALVKPYRLILTDLTMPDLSGFEALAQIRNAPGPNQNTTICAISGDPSADLNSNIQATGFDASYEKPINLALLRRLFQWASEPDLPRFVMPVD